MNTTKIGVLMLDTSFNRPIGDIGNPASFSFPVTYEIVEKATVERVLKKADRSVIDPFILAAKKMERKGVKAITTSCGLLALFQKDIQQELSVPFYSSALIQIPMVSLIVGGTVGVLTASKKKLTNKHLEGVDVDPAFVVTAGMDQMPAFTQAIVDETAPLDMEQVALEIMQAIKELVENNPDIRAIVLECTNLPPYKEAIKRVTDLPIFDIHSLTNYVYHAL